MVRITDCASDPSVRAGGSLPVTVTIENDLSTPDVVTHATSLFPLTVSGGPDVGLPPVAESSVAEVELEPGESITVNLTLPVPADAELPELPAEAPVTLGVVADAEGSTGTDEVFCGEVELQASTFTADTSGVVVAGIVVLGLAYVYFSR